MPISVAVEICQHQKFSAGVLAGEPRMAGREAHPLGELRGFRVTTSTASGRIVYLNRLAAQVLHSQRTLEAKPADRVFPLADRVTPDDISKGFAVVCRRLGIEDFHLHDLRHTAAS